MTEVVFTHFFPPGTSLLIKYVQQLVAFFSFLFVSLGSGVYLVFLVPARYVGATPAPRDAILCNLDDHSAYVRVGIIHIRRGVMKILGKRVFSAIQ